MKAFKFTQYLVYWLYDHKQIAIPGIGIFNLERTPSSQVAGETILNPPSYKITFQEDRSKNTDELFFRKLKIYSPGTSKKEYSEYGELLEGELKNNQKIRIDGIGLLFLNEGHLNFEQDLNTADLLSRHYAKVQMKFFSRPAKAISWLNLQLSKLPHKYWTIFLPLIGALALASSVFILKNRVSNNTTKIDPKTEISEPLTKTPNQQLDNVLDSILEDSGSVKIDSVGITNEGEVIRQCIIITGAYRSEMYKNLMIERIKKEGYKVYTEDVNGLVRVGLQFECTDAILAEMLEKIRSTFDKNAWHLEEKEG